MKKTMLSIVMILLCVLVQSQVVSEPTINNNQTVKDFNIQKITPPNASMFHQTKLLGVNNYTGSASVNIPLYQITQGDITIPIGLNYLSTGVKANDISSNVGLNWSLDAGGMITKVIKGFEDFSVKFNSPLRNRFPEESGPDPICPDSYVCYFSRKLKYDDFERPLLALEGFDLIPAPNSETVRFKLQSYISNLGWFLGKEDLSIKTFFDYSSGYADKIFTQEQLSHARTKKDTYPDLFYVNAPGLNTKFTHRKDKTPFEIENQGNKISTTIGKSNIIPFFPLFYNGDYRELKRTYYGSKPRRLTCINNIKITNINGVKYEFAELDVNQYITRDNLHRFTSDYPAHMSSQEVTSYHLSSIEDTKGNTVFFEYEKYKPQKISSSKSQRFVLNIDGVAKSYNLPSVTETYFPQLNRVRKIRYDKGSVEFLYDHQRKDLIGDKALTEIIVRDVHNKIIKKIKFHYDYFVSNTNCNEAYCLRLKLKKITEVNTLGEKLPPYKFYYDETQLPEIGTSTVDYLGYANTIKSDYSDDRSHLTFLRAPKLFYKYKKHRLSFSPIKIFNDSYIIKGHEKGLIPSFKYTQAGTLLEIKKPTGARQFFTYELNTFSTEEVKNITAAGLRLKKQVVKDEKGHVKLLEEYIYINEQENSSGVINSIPSFGDVLIRPYNLNLTSSVSVESGIKNGNLTMRTYSSPKNEFHTVQGSHISYDRVVVKNGINNGTIEKEYYTVNDYPIEQPESYVPLQVDRELSSAIENGGAFPFFNNKDVLLGKLKGEKIRDENNQLKSEKVFTYEYKLFEEIQEEIRLFKSHFVYTPPASDFNFVFSPKIYSHRNLETKIETKTYFNLNEMKSTVETKYDALYPIVKESKKKNRTNIFLNKNYYPHDITGVGSLSGGGLTSTELEAINKLNEQHKVANPIQTETYKNATLIGRQRTNFKNWDNNIILPKNIKASKGESVLEERIVFKKYDNNGNVVEFSKKNGVNTYYVWGYNKKQPIAKIEGYTLITTAQKSLIAETVLASNLDNDRTVGAIGTEGNLRSKLNELRNSFTNTVTTQVTTYTYDELIGITSITDARGKTVYYNYDDFNRLEFIKDSENNVITQYCYNYKGEKKKCNETVINNDVDEDIITTTTSETYIKLKPESFMIPTPANIKAFKYDWEEIRSLTKDRNTSSHQIFYHPLVFSGYHPPYASASPISGLDINLYSLDESFNETGEYWPVHRDGYYFSLEGLDKITIPRNYLPSTMKKDDLVLRWSMLVDGKEYPLIKTKELIPNVFFVPYRFNEKLGKIICRIYGPLVASDLDVRNKPIHIVVSHEIPLKKGLEHLDNHNVNFDFIKK
jgi:YD repeat-containing protein